MADTVRNPYYDDPYIAKIASNISGIFKPADPEKLARSQYYTLQNDKLNRESAGRSKLGALFRSQTLDPREIGATGIESDVDPKVVSGYTLYNLANTGAPDAAVGRAYVGEGHAINENQAFSTQGEADVAKRQNDAAFSRTKYSADSSAGATIGAANIHEAGADRRQYREPIHVTPGSGLILNPGDTRRPTDMAPGSVYVPVPAKPSADKFVVVEGPEGKPVYKQAVDAAKEGNVATTAKAPTPTDINPNEVADLEYNAIADAGGLSDDGKSVNPEFRKMFGARMAQAKEAAAKAYQKSRNAADGIAAYRDTLGIQPGARFKPAGTPIIGSGPAAMVPPDGAPAGAPAAPAAATPSAPPAPLTPTERKPGAIYSTPKGNAKWTGTGWVPVQ